MAGCRNNIIPVKPLFQGVRKNIDKKAVAIFTATGFFLDQDTYYKEQRALKPGHNYSVDQFGNYDEGTPYFNWSYNPIDRPFDQIVEEFKQLFEEIIKEQTNGVKVILPLSGGLDSRTQAVALKNLKAEVNSYSYEFEGGYQEAKISEQIAQIQGFDFKKFTIQRSYLWECIDDLAEINQCYSEFTHPRQMAVIDDLGSMGDVFNLGHWGDVLFDDMGVDDNLSFQEQVDVLVKKILKKGGLELGEALWKEWDLEGCFFDYLRARVEVLLKDINIPNSANAQIRAFKSLYWAPRWTSVNLSVFEKIKPIHLPYYDNRMCEFITTIPEKYLSKRQIQIEYIKRYAPKVARVTWQENKPFNLYNHHLNRSPYNLPFRVLNKLKRTFSSQQYVQRNWELQFLGEENEKELEQRLFTKSNLVSEKTRNELYTKFTNVDGVKYSHPVSMLLTLMTWEKQRANKP